METKRVYSDANRAEQRSYRPFQPSDLPQIQSGKLKAYWKGLNDLYVPVKLISTNFETRGNDQCLWLIMEKEGDRICNSHLIVVDVTPEKRYAIWNHTHQRFVNNGDHPTAHGFRTKQEAEIYLQDHFPTQKKLFYIVEWEIKSNDW